MSEYVTVQRGDHVRAFDPRTFGVIKTGRITTVSPNLVRINFGVTGSAVVRREDVVENLGRGGRRG